MTRNNWNPFVTNSEKKLLTIGLICFLFAALLTNWNNLVLLGSFKIANAHAKSWYASIFNLGMVIAANTLLLYLFAVLRYSKTRFIDVLNSVLIAHIAMYLLLLITIIPFVSDFIKSIEFLVLDNLENPAQIPLDKVVLMMAFGVVSMGCLVFFFVLLIMGMKIAMNSKKGLDTIFIILSTLLMNTVLQFINIYL